MPVKTGVPSPPFTEGIVLALHGHIADVRSPKGSLLALHGVIKPPFMNYRRFRQIPRSMHTVNGVQGKNPGIVSVSTSDTDEILHGTAVYKCSGHCRDESQQIVIHINSLSPSLCHPESTFPRVIFP